MKVILFDSFFWIIENQLFQSTLELLVLSKNFVEMFFLVRYREVTMLQKKKFHINFRQCSEHELVQFDYYNIFERKNKFQTVDHNVYKILKI